MHAASQWRVACFNCQAVDGGDVKDFRELFLILKVLTSLILFVFLQDFAQIKVKPIKIGAANQVCLCIISVALFLNNFVHQIVNFNFFHFFACVFLPYTSKDCNSEYVPKTY